MLAQRKKLLDKGQPLGIAIGLLDLALQVRDGLGSQLIDEFVGIGQPFLDVRAGQEDSSIIFLSKHPVDLISPLLILRLLFLRIADRHGNGPLNGPEHIAVGVLGPKLIALRGRLGAGIAQHPLHVRDVLGNLGTFILQSA